MEQSAKSMELRGPRVPDEREHEAARELHREEDPAPDGSDDGVELDGLDPEVQGEEREVVLVGAVDAALRVGLPERGDSRGRALTGTSFPPETARLPK